MWGASFAACFIKNHLQLINNDTIDDFITIIIVIVYGIIINIIIIKNKHHKLLESINLHLFHHKYDHQHFHDTHYD